LAGLGTQLALARSIRAITTLFANYLEPDMADRTALGRIGLMLGAATMMVMMVGAFVVTDHLTGRMHIDDGSTVVELSAASH
jgi:hypothetical protein